MTGMREATAYLQVEGRDPGSGYDWGRWATVHSVSNKKPKTVRPGCIVVKVRLRIPVEAWEPFAPEAVIEVPTELVQKPVVVEAVDADV